MPKYWLTREVFKRALALVYLIAFLVIVHQFLPLLGEKGLLPVPQFVKLASFTQAPSIFHFFPKDLAFMLFGLIGVILSLLALTGVSERFGTPFSMLVWGALWANYLSFVNVGQRFYGFGWESMLLETGFIAIFLGASKTTPNALTIWLLRWILFRSMFGAGLIKLRGDPCWQEATCLFYHYETQPMPNPLSWFFHWAPEWIGRGGVLFNHFSELVVPFSYFAPQPFAAVGGIITILFQGLLMLGGNFSFLNLLIIVLAISTISDRALLRLIPIAPTPKALSSSPFHTTAVWMLTLMVVVLSIPPVLNLLSPRQIMNINFNPLHLVNTYGAFGSVTKERFEIIIEGTDEEEVTESTQWKPYEFIGKPGNPKRLPPQIAPYHLRLDWLMWFAAFRQTAQDPWFFHLAAKLLEGDKATLALFKTNPFPNQPPHYIRALYYKYNFTTPSERRKTGHFWKRELDGIYLPPVSLKDPNFQSILKQFGW